MRQVHTFRKLTKAVGAYQTKRAAEGLAEKTLRPLNNGVLVAESTITLNRFMATVYLPYAEHQKRRPRLSVIATCGSADVTTTINICVKMVSQDAEEAMKKLESKCYLVVPQLPFDSPKLETKIGDVSASKTLTLEAVRGNLAERGDSVRAP